MKFRCISDLHGYLPTIPDCDVLLLAGDYCPYVRDQHWWFRDKFAPYIEELAERMTVVGVAGNHDFMFEKYPHLAPKMPWTYLQDSSTIIQGLKIYGTPWQPRFRDWAFNLDEPELVKKWDLIPDDTDILLLHGPPRDHGDLSIFGYERIGSPSLTERIKTIQPKLVVCGHNHSGFGRYTIGTSIILNVAHVDDRYRVAHDPVEIEL